MIAVVGGVILLCCLLVAVGYAVTGSRSSQTTTGGQATAPNSATLTLAYSPEKAALIKDLIGKFNAKGLRTSDRQPMRVELLEMTSEDMVTQALAGPKFQALTPDSSLWLDQLNRRWIQSQPQSGPGQIATRLAGEPVRYAISPLVIAAWEDSARALGWPDKPVGWSTLQQRARSDTNFKWSHPSTAYASGLLATLAEFYAGAGVQRGLTADLAQDQKTVDFVTAVEKTVRFYGEAELAVMQRVVKEGPKSLDAFVVSEQLVVAFNTGAFGKPPARLVALYPAEGTLWADHPLSLLETPDVTANQRQTFQALRDFLGQADTQTQILRAGYRPADLSIPLDSPGSPLTEANGVNRAEPQTTLQLPSPDVVAVVQNTWALTKRRTNVMLVVDTSGSMRGDKLNNAQAALRAFLSQIPSDQERVGMVEFNSSVVNIIEMDTLANNRATLSGNIDRLQANGNTAMLDAVNTAYGRLQQLNDPERINAIVVMTDGKENASRISLGELADKIRNSGQKTIIFCVAYGSDADYNVLQTLADASGGLVRAGTPETIKELYKILSTYL